MAHRIYYPLNWNDELTKYEQTENHKIKERYDLIFRENVENIRENINNKFSQDKINHETHCELLSCAIHPFLRNEIQNYELLFLEPLMYARNIGEIDENIPIWDFLLGEISDNNINRIILGEVKGQKPSSSENLPLMTEKYSKSEILNKIYEYLQKDPNVIINERNLKVEKVLVVDNYLIDEYLKSVKDRKLPFNIWEIRHNLPKIEYQFHIHRKEEILENEIPFNKNDMIYRGMLNTLSSKKFPITKEIYFTYGSDFFLVIDKFKRIYQEKFGLIINDDFLICLIKEMGGGKFYDDERLMEDFVERIKRKFIELNLVNVETSFYKIMPRINVKNREIERRLKKYIDDNEGRIILNRVIKEIRPKKSTIGMFKPLDDFMK